jgi:hypothetical protein
VILGSLRGVDLVPGGEVTVAKRRASGLRAASVLNSFSSGGSTGHEPEPEAFFSPRLRGRKIWSFAVSSGDVAKNKKKDAAKRSSGKSRLKIVAADLFCGAGGSPTDLQKLGSMYE